MEKQEIKDILARVVAYGILFLLTLGFVMAFTTEAKAAQLKVGDCFQITFPESRVEPWDAKPDVYRVEEVGIKKYRVSWLNFDNKEWRNVKRQEGLNLTYEKTNRFIESVACPKE